MQAKTWFFKVRREPEPSQRSPAGTRLLVTQSVAPLPPLHGNEATRRASIQKYCDLAPPNPRSKSSKHNFAHFLSRISTALLASKAVTDSVGEGTKTLARLSSFIFPTLAPFHEIKLASFPPISASSPHFFADSIGHTFAPKVIKSNFKSEFPQLVVRINWREAVHCVDRDRVRHLQLEWVGCRRYCSS